MQKITLNDFTGGLSEVTRADLIEDNQCQVIENMEVNTNGILQKVKGFTENYAIRGLSGTIVSAYLWNPYFKYKEYDYDHVLIVTKVTDNSYNLYFHIYNTELQTQESVLIKSFLKRPQLAITDKKVYCVDGFDSNYMYYTEINKEGELEHGVYNVTQPNLFLGINKKIETNIVNGSTLLPFGVTVQYCYTFENDEGMESRPSPVLTYKMNQFLFEDNTDENADIYEMYLQSIQAEITFQTADNIKYINIYRRHVIYHYDVGGYSPFYKTKRLKASTTNFYDSSEQNVITLEDQSYLIKGDDILFVDNMLFVANGFKDLDFIIQGKYTKKITINNDSARGIVNPLICINLTDTGLIALLEKEEARPLIRIIDMDMSTPCKAHYIKENKNLYIEIPYIYPSSTHYLYILQDCELPTTWANETYGNIKIDDLENFVLTCISTEPVIRDADCDQCTGNDLFRNNPAKLSGIRNQDIQTIEDDYYYAEDKETSNVLSLASKKIRLLKEFPLKKQTRGYMLAQFYLDSNTPADNVLFQITNEYTRDKRYKIWLHYDTNDSHVKLSARSLHDQSYTFDSTLFLVESNYLATQIIFSWDTQYIGDYTRSLKIHYRNYTLSGLTQINTYNFSYPLFWTLQDTDIISSKALVYKADLCNLYIDSNKFVTLDSTAEFLLNTPYLFLNIVTSRSSSGEEYDGFNYTLEGDVGAGGGNDNEITNRRGLLYYSDEKMSFPPLNYIDTRKNIKRIVSAPLFLSDDLYNSIMIFNDDRIDRFVVKKDFEGALLSKNIISHLENNQLKYSHMIGKASDKLYWLCNEGIMELSGEGIKNITEYIINLKSLYAEINEYSFIQYLPDKEQVWIVTKNTILIYDLNRGIFSKMTVSDNYIKQGYFKNNNSVFISSDTKRLSYPSSINTISNSKILSKKYNSNAHIKKIRTKSKFSTIKVYYSNRKSSGSETLTYDSQTDTYVLPQGIKGDMTLEINNPETLEKLELFVK